MKKFIFFALLASFAFTTVAFAWVKGQINSSDYMATIETQKNGNLFIYKVSDTANKATCYVMTNDFVINAQINGGHYGISCVK